MSSRIVRASKYRHVFCEPEKSDNCYSGLSLSTQTGDHTYVKGSTKFFSVAVRGGGGPVMVLPYEKVGRVKPGSPVITGHHGNVYDTDWNPFNPNMLATTSDDSTCKIWGIPDGGLTENMTEPLADLVGHGKPVTFCQFNPHANNVLATASKDHTVKIWDIEKQEANITLNYGDAGLVQDLQWDREGKTVLVSSKDKHFRVFDVRADSVVAEWAAHEGAKCSKGVFLDAGSGKVMTVGFTKQSGREMRLWDLRDTSKKLKKVEIDTASGVIFPFYDEDTKMLYLGGKGDGNIRYYELENEKPYVFPITEHRSSVSAKGIYMLPKRAADVMKCEVARFLKLTTSAVEPLHFYVPRKSESFQDDIFPDHAGFVPGTQAEAWFGGADDQAPKQSMNPTGSGGASGGAGGAAASFKVSKSAAVLQKELDAANARIAELEAELAALKTGGDS